MRKLDLISSAFWLIVAILICAGSLRFDLGGFKKPGPGFLPFGAGLVLGGLALVVMINALRKSDEDVGVFWEDPTRKYKVFLTLILIIVYTIILEPLGFPVATLLVIGFLLRFIYPQRWRNVIIGALLITMGSYIIFQVLLEAQLPKGFLGF
jgi:putative tricarboxylic transport membrane protein